jgi:hypothetical protein
MGDNYEQEVEAIKKAITRLPMIGKMAITEWLEELGDDLYYLTDPDAPKPQRSREVVKVRQVGKALYQLEWVRCGNKRCKACPHGPYWYGYRRQNKRLKSWYIGKDLEKYLKAQAATGDRSDSEPPHTLAAGEPR